MAEKDEIEALSATGSKLIEIINPCADRALIEKKIRHAQAHHLLAGGLDIDHAFGKGAGMAWWTGRKWPRSPQRSLRSSAAWPATR